MDVYGPPTAGAKVTADEYAAIEDQCRLLLGTQRDTFVFQGEAVVALEAAARGIVRSGSRALNLVSGPYGETFGRWLGQSGATVEHVTVPFDRAVPPEHARDAIERMGHVDVVSLVHAEAATGARNNLAAIADIAKSAGALTVVDAVASWGAETIEADGWDLDVVVLSTQKALAGPSGASVVIVSDRAWDAFEANSSMPRPSVLSLLDWRDRWVRAGRAVLPVIPNHLETRALGTALTRAASEGIGYTVARHQAAAGATRAALAPLGLEPWVAQSVDAAAVATLVKVPLQGGSSLVDAVRRADLGAAAHILAPAPAPLSEQALRVSHTGKDANLGAVLAAIAALTRVSASLGRRPDVGAALGAAEDAWSRAFTAR